MDWSSPGNQPAAFGNTCGGAITTACIIGPFNPWPGYQPTYAPPTYVPLVPVQTKLADDDVERIARRVAQLLREVKP